MTFYLHVFPVNLPPPGLNVLKIYLIGQADLMRSAKAGCKKIESLRLLLVLSREAMAMLFLKFIILTENG